MKVHVTGSRVAQAAGRTLGRVSKPIVNWHEQHRASLTTGQRAADLMRNGMGSWMFVGGFVVFMILWAILNTVLVAAKWDPYPFILLNLFLSMLAGLQGAILLIAAKRQDAIAAALAHHDYDTNLAAKADIEQLMDINRKQLVIIQELHELLTDVGETPRSSRDPNS
jgi:uncharacterized membrane protein